MSGQLPRCPLNFEIVLTLCQYMSEKFHTLPSQTWLTTLVIWEVLVVLSLCVIVCTQIYATFLAVFFCRPPKTFVFLYGQFY